MSTTQRPLTTSQAGEMLGYERKSILRMIDAGKLEAYRMTFGGHYRIPISSIERFKKEMTKKATAFGAYVLLSAFWIFLIDAIATPDLSMDSTVNHSHRVAIREWKRKGCPIPRHPISHRQDGTLIVGTADCYGNQ